MKWPVWGTSFGFIVLSRVLQMIAHWYKSDGITTSHTNDDYDLLLLGTFAASIVGMALSGIDLRLSRGLRRNRFIAWIGFVVNASLWPVAFVLADWVARVNDRWLDCVNNTNSGPC